MAALRVVAGLLAVTSATLLYFIIAEFNPFLRRCNPAICQSYALTAFHAHSVRQRGEGYCDYGVLPGFLSFNVMKPPGLRWQTAVKSCQVKSLLLPSAAMGRTKVLLLGDSVDAHIAQQWCLLLEQPLQVSHVGIKGSIADMAAAAVAATTSSSSSSGRSFIDSTDPAAMKSRDAFYYCRPGKAAAGRPASISVGMFHLPGVHLSGPYHTGVRGNFLVRIPAALKAFNTTFGGPPDLVVVHSNFWDQSRMFESRESRLEGYGAINKLMPDVVFSWSSNFSLLLSTTRELLPEDTLLATRTAAFPAFSANWLGRWHYVHQLNMAALEVTRLHGLPVIDLGGMVFGLEPRQYLDDQHHPNKIVLLECANIAMNLLHQQRKRLAAERRAAELQEQLGQGTAGGAEDAANEDAAAASSTAAAGQDSDSSSADADSTDPQQQEQDEQQRQEPDQDEGSIGAAASNSAPVESGASAPDDQAEQERQKQQQRQQVAHKEAHQQHPKAGKQQPQVQQLEPEGQGQEQHSKQPSTG